MATTQKKGMNPIVMLLIAVAIFLILRKFVFKPIQERNNADVNEISTQNNISGNVSTGGGSAPTTTPINQITDKTVFVAKTPMMIDKRVGWIQNTYNAYTRERKAAGKTPDYPIIEVDDKYYTETANAVNRYMGQYHTSWEAFKKRINYLRSQL